jgi:hypothetical protein
MHRCVHDTILVAECKKEAGLHELRVEREDRNTNSERFDFNQVQQLNDLS